MSTIDFTKGNRPKFLILIYMVGFTMVCLVLTVAFIGKPSYAQEEEEANGTTDCKWTFEHASDNASTGYLLNECTGDLYRIVARGLNADTATASKVEL